jgi:hypothetical protein
MPDRPNSAPSPLAAEGRDLRRPARDYHTTAGWWLMTHELGAGVLIGAAALAVLGADLLYTVSRWTGSFSRSFLITLVGMSLAWALAWLLRPGRPIGADRQAARRHENFISGVRGAFIVAIVAIGYWLGGNFAGELLGMVAAVAAGVTVLTMAALAKKH